MTDARHAVRYQKAADTPWHYQYLSHCFVKDCAVVGRKVLVIRIYLNTRQAGAIRERTTANTRHTIGYTNACNITAIGECII